MKACHFTYINAAGKTFSESPLKNGKDRLFTDTLLLFRITFFLLIVPNYLFVLIC